MWMSPEEFYARRVLRWATRSRGALSVNDAASPTLHSALTQPSTAREARDAPTSSQGSGSPVNPDWCVALMQNSIPNITRCVNAGPLYN